MSGVCPEGGCDSEWQGVNCALSDVGESYIVEVAVRDESNVQLYF